MNRSINYSASVPRNNNRNIDRARDLRSKQTPPEGILWKRLRDRRLGGLKFRRQYPVQGLVVDFCCTEARLVVEVDSRYHDGRTKEDAARDRLLEEDGF
ncbi:MAG: endonuclease domain-containing protein [Phycisphaerales bacterium JB040]